MKTDSILKADLIDIIFENRNKDYGAYPLRKYYHERLYKALGITFLFISALSLYIFLYKPNIVITIPYVIGETGFTSPPKTEKLKQRVAEKPKQPIVPKGLKTQMFTSVIKLVDSTDVSTKLSNLDSAVISNANTDEPGKGKQIIKTPVTETTTGNTNESVKNIDKNKPLASAEIMPSYPGGTEALIKFLKKNLASPEDLGAEETVSVKIMFIVGYDGVLKGFQTVEDGGATFNNEVIRVLKKMPAWIPGKLAGENVSVYYTIPVKFVPQE